MINRIAEAVLLAIMQIAGAYFIAIMAVSPRQPWLAWIGLMPLILAVRNLSVTGAFFSGALWGGSIFYFTTAVPDTGFSSSFLTLILIILVPALYTGAMGLYRRRFGFSPLAIALGWIILEASLKAAGVYQGLLSADLGSGPVLQLVAGFLGYGFVAFLVAYTNAVLLSLPWNLRFDTGWLFMNRIVVRVGHPSVILEHHIHSAFNADRLRPRAPPELRQARANSTAASQYFLIYFDQK